MIDATLTSSAMLRSCAVRAALILALAVSAAGCRQDEQNRPLSFTPGVYQGEKLPELSDAKTRELQERGNLQR